MAEPIVFESAATILTLAGDTGPRAGEAMSDLGRLDGGTIVAEDGVIRWVGPAGEVPAAWSDAERIDCRGCTIMPAFVDSHTHLVWGGDRRDELEMRLAGEDYEAIFAAGGGILSSVRQTREASPAELYEQSLRRVRRMQASGTTTFEIKSGYGLDLDTEIKQLRVIKRLREEAGVRLKATCLAAHAVPAEARESEATREAFIDSVCALVLPAVAAEGLADYCDVFCERGAFTVDESRRVLTTAQELGLELRVHANEFGHTGGARVAAELGARSADHLLHVDDEERAELREAGVVATLLPGTSLVLGKGYANGRALIEDGVPVAVATDCNPGSCPIENLAMVLGLACYGNRLSPAEAICATTHNAAASMGLDAEVGSLVVGRSADLLVLATNDYRDLVYHAGSPLIRDVYSRGRSLQPAG